MTVDTTTLASGITTKTLDTNVMVNQVYIDTTVTPLTSGQDYKLFTIPKGAMVLSAGLAVKTGEGAADTVDLGVTGTLNQFLDDKSLQTAGSSYASATTGAYIATADISLVLLANAAITAAKFSVYCAYVMLNGVEAEI